jgi:hypothetical protein
MTHRHGATATESLARLVPISTSAKLVEIEKDNKNTLCISIHISKFIQFIGLKQEIFTNGTSSPQGKFELALPVCYRSFLEGETFR